MNSHARSVLITGVTLAVGIFASDPASADYTYRDLGALSTGNNISVATGITSSGVVIGGSNHRINFIDYAHACIWSPPDYLINDLGLPDLEAARFAFGNSLNDNRIAVGRLNIDIGPYVHRAYTRDIATRTWNIIPPLGGDGYSNAFWISTPNQGYSTLVVGVSAKIDLLGDLSDLKAFAYEVETGRLTALPSLGGRESIAWSASGTGAVVGEADIDFTGSTSHAFFYANGTISDLGAGDGNVDSVANAISQKGDLIVGAAGLFQEPATFGAVCWTANADGRFDLINLGQLELDVNTTALAVNGKNTIVGRAIYGASTDSPSLHAWVWQSDQGFRDLNDPQLVRGIPSGWVLQEGSGINDTGQIVGTAIKQDRTGTARHAFLLTPVQ